MKSKPASQPRTFTLRRITAYTLFSAATLLAYISFAAATAGGDTSSSASAAAIAPDWQNKVDPRVLSAASAGPTEFIVYMAQQADLSGSAALTTKDEKGMFVHQQKTGIAEATQPPVRSLLTQLGATYQSFWISNALSTKGDLAVIEAVASLAEVAAIYPMGQGALNLPPEEGATASSTDGAATNLALADPSPEPGLLRVNADDVWALGFEGQGVVVGGSDTGVRWTHAALKNQYRGWNGTTVNHDYNWHDAIHLPNFVPPPNNPCNPGGPTGAGQPSPEPCDDDSHGTHTVGTMVGDDGAANRVGMAPQAKWIACRNMGSGVGIIPTYLECMEWMLAPTKIDGTSPDPTKAPHVINNSWGCLEACPPEPNPLRDAVQASRAAGIVYVASAGNNGPACGTVQAPPGRYPESFTVGNTTHTTDVISSSSSRGPTAVDPDNPASPLYVKPNISAPGATIRSTVHGNDTAYGNKSGTSMAGPHVAGLVALLISANPALAGNVDRIETIIEQTAVKKPVSSPGELCGTDAAGSVPNNTYGWGRIDALSAVNMALADAAPLPLAGVVSRKTHGTVGTFDVSLPLTGAVGIENRNASGANANRHQVVFLFSQPVTASDATVTPGSNEGATAERDGSGPPAISPDGKQITVSLKNVSNAQTLSVDLLGVTGSGGGTPKTISVPMGVLAGDVNETRIVDGNDVSAVQANTRQRANSANFRADVNITGLIDGNDVSATQSQTRTSLPANP